MYKPSWKSANRNTKDADLDPSLLPATRIHPLPILTESSCRIFLKREDEAGFAIAGGKKRKYASLLPWLQQHHFQEAAIIGGSNSNNVVGLSQLLLERGIRPVLFVKAGHGGKLAGNRFLTELLVKQEDWKVVDGEEWGKVESLAAEYVAERAGEGTKVAVIPEGANCEAAWPEL